MVIKGIDCWLSGEKYGLAMSWYEREREKQNAWTNEPFNMKYCDFPLWRCEWMQGVSKRARDWILLKVFCAGFVQ